MTQVWMKHEETGGFAQTTQEALDEVHGKNGWVAQDPSEEELAAMEKKALTADPNAGAGLGTSVAMTHPDIPDAEPALVTEDAFNEVWGPKGWQRAAAPEGGSPESEVDTSGSGTGTPPSGDSPQ